MKPEEYLEEVFRNVKSALDETLRYDYGPDLLTQGYFEECDARLTRIASALATTPPAEIAARVAELTRLAVWISRIERSRLGEFSWPFAMRIRDIAEPLLEETTVWGRSKPIVHVIAEGNGYQITYEARTSASSKRRFVVVAFPRPLKHHVLLHTIFGHELGHAAQATSGAGAELQVKARVPLSAKGHLSNAASLTKWVHDAAAHPSVKAALGIWLGATTKNYEFSDAARLKWIEEFICDLFGLLLFGPAFVAAHKALLQPTHRSPYTFLLQHPTHPPYAARHKMLVSSIKLLGWDKPIVAAGNINKAELEVVKYLCDDPYSDWAKFFDDKQLSDALQGIGQVLKAYGGFGYAPPSADTVEELVAQLTRSVPPVASLIDQNGAPLLTKTPAPHALYAGWIYWLGRKHLGLAETLDFLDINRLCDQALLQECAIEKVVSARP